MTTRVDLRNLVRRRLGDLTAPYQFSDLQLNQWINDALADVSIELPRKITATITTEAGVQVYDLPADFRAAVSVEYPTGEDAPVYLGRSQFQREVFWGLDGKYDVVDNNDQAQAAVLAISDIPGEDETITILYLADQVMLDDDGDVCSLPDRHLELVVLYVRWAAFQELAAQQSADPDVNYSGSITSSAMSALELNAQRAEGSYRFALARAVRAAAESGAVVWKMDKWS